MNRIFLAALSLSLLWTSCENREQKQAARFAPYNKFVQQERGLDSIPDSLATPLRDFAVMYPGNANSADYLFAAASLYERQGKWYQSAENFEQYVKLFPAGKKLERAMLASAHNYVESGNTKKGKAMYEAFLQKFPNSKLAEDVRLLLPDIELSPEQLLEKVLQRARQDSLNKVQAQP
jgi:tetratricopeptide (TPR) repeat protein